MDASDNVYRFNVTQLSGGAQLVTLRSLDREVSQSFIMTLIARDGGQPPLTDSVRIEVEVLDMNDIAPVFSISEYRFSLSEDANHDNFVIFHVSE